jgi:hypothetical protein
MHIILATARYLQGNRREGKKEIEKFIQSYRESKVEFSSDWNLQGVKFLIDLNVNISDTDKILIYRAIDILEGVRIEQEKSILWLESALSS